MRNILKIAISALFLAAAPFAQAQDQPITLEGDVLAVVESVDANGATQTELVEPGTIVPGDRLMFSTTYTNTGSEPVENFTMTNPLPGPVRLAPDADPELVVSVDAGTSWGRLSELTVTGPDGASRPADHADVTHIRWSLAVVLPGETGRLEYPAIIR